MNSKILALMAVLPAAIMATGASTALAQTPDTAAVINAGANVSANTTVGTGSTTVNAKASAKVQAQITHAQTRADQELDRRTTSLTALKTRVGQMTHISDDNKTSIQSAIDAQISAVATLKAKIDADTDVATLKTDVQSITKAYRIYMLILPQAQIMATADRLIDVAGELNTLAAKIQLRITAAKNAGVDTSKDDAAFADYNAKVADAVTQANAAFSAVASLQPDNGDQATMTANHDALVKARGDLKTGMQDIQAARKDFTTIRTDLGKMKIPTATTTASTSASATADTSASTTATQ